MILKLSLIHDHVQFFCESVVSMTLLGKFGKPIESADSGRFYKYNFCLDLRLDLEVAR